MPPKVVGSNPTEGLSSGYDGISNDLNVILHRPEFFTGQFYLFGGRRSDFAGLLGCSSCRCCDLRRRRRRKLAPELLPAPRCRDAGLGRIDEAELVGLLVQKDVLCRLGLQALDELRVILGAKQLEISLILSI